MEYNVEGKRREAFVFRTLFSTGQVEVSVWDDGSTDGSAALIDGYREPLENLGAKLILGSSTGPPRGCG